MRFKTLRTGLVVKSFLACAMLFGMPCRVFAKSGAQHLVEINAAFGNEFLESELAQDVFKFISEGMDYGSGDKPVDLAQRGSSFLETVRKKYPLFTGKHREFAHWGSNRAIPQKVIDAFETVYPGQKSEFVNLWREYVVTRREAMRQLFGLSEDATHVAQSLYTRVEIKHLLGDWTTADTDGLQPLEEVVDDWEKAMRRIRGRNDGYTSEVVSQCRKILNDKTLSKAEQASGISRLVDSSWGKIKPILQRYGFKGAMHGVEWEELSRKVGKLVAATPVEFGPGAGEFKTSSWSGKGRTGPLRRGVVHERGASRWKSAGRLCRRWLPKIAIAADIGLLGYESWGYQREYSKKEISKGERDRKIVGAGGRAGGALVGGWAGKQLGEKLFDDGEGSGEQALVKIGVAAVAVIGAYVGSWIAERISELSYDAVMGSPFEQACKLALEGDGDVEAMRYVGEYLWNGKYTQRDRSLAVECWCWIIQQDNKNKLALMRVGNCCFTGEGIEKTPHLAMALWCLAGEAGDADGYIKIANCYLMGDGCEQSYRHGLEFMSLAAKTDDKAIDYLRKLYDDARLRAFANEPEGEYVLGVFLEVGCPVLGIKGNVENAFPYYEDAGEAGFNQALDRLAELSRRAEVDAIRSRAEQGDAASQFSFGKCRLEGDGVERNKEDAVKWFLKAAEQGDLQAMNYLGDFYHAGVGVEQNFTEAVKWYFMAAKQGDAESQFDLCGCYMRGDGVAKDPNEAAKWLRMAAEQGHVGAEHDLGLMCFNGDGVDADKNEGVKWLRKSAEQGHPRSQRILGDLYYSGIVVTQNKEEAVMWYRKAAEQGDATAQRCVGDCYYSGITVTKDLNEAVLWYQKAAGQGDATAQRNLGTLYWEGLGVKKNREEAVKWYQKAAEQGDAASIHILNEYHQKMKPRCAK